MNSENQTNSKLSTPSSWHFPFRVVTGSHRYYCIAVTLFTMASTGMVVAEQPQGSTRRPGEMAQVAPSPDSAITPHDSSLPGHTPSHKRSDTKMGSVGSVNLDKVGDNFGSMIEATGDAATKQAPTAESLENNFGDALEGAGDEVTGK